MIPPHLLAGPSSASMGMGHPSGSSSMHRRSSLSPPGGAHMARRPSSLRMSSSACDLQDEDEDGEKDEQKDEEEEGEDRRTGRLPLPSAGLRGWRPEQSPTSSESSDDHDGYDFDQDHFSSPPCTSSSSSSLSLNGEDNVEAPQRTRQPQPPSPKSRSCPSLPSAPRRRPIAALSALTPASSNSPGGGTISLPKAQPLARTLFARMADTPHAGTGLGLLGGGGNRKGGKPKMIVATKPMRTTFELGLTSSELARRF